VGEWKRGDGVKNVILIGFMGTGKTSTGKALATRLGCAFIDLDQKIEEEQGMTIPEIFAKFGEEHFRALEREAVRKVADRKNAVVSTGGGTVKNPANVEMLRSSGIIIALTASAETVFLRTQKKGARPVLDNAGGDRREVIEKLMAEREKLYENADYTVDTSESSPMQVVDEIVRHLKIRGIIHG